MTNMNKEQTMYYQQWATDHPVVFCEVTYPDLQRLAQGDDSQGLVAEGIVPDLGAKAWAEVVDALQDALKSATKKKKYFEKSLDFLNPFL